MVESEVPWLGHMQYKMRCVVDVSNHTGASVLRLQQILGFRWLVFCVPTRSVYNSFVKAERLDWRKGKGTWCVNDNLPVKVRSYCSYESGGG